MTDRALYVLAIPNDAQSRTTPQARAQTATQGTLGSDTGTVQSVATEPGEESLQLGYRGKFAEKMAREMTELMKANAIDAVPYFGLNETTPEDGYYEITAAPSGRQDPRFEAVVTVDPALTKEGTRSSHRRSVATEISDVSHPFGNGQTAYVGVPATASKIRWYDSQSGAKEDPTLVETRSSEHGDVDIYDARAASAFDPPETFPEIVFDIPYEEEGKTDPRVYDTRGFDDRTDGDGVLQWGKVFVSSHDYQGDAVLTNDLIRLTVDESAPSLSAAEWDDSNSQWTSTTLGASDWAFFDLDIREISLTGIKAVVEFSNPEASPTEYYTLRMVLKRGWNTPLWTEIKGEGGIPNGVVTLLDPIASSSAYDPGESQGLRKRSDL